MTPAILRRLSALLITPEQMAEVLEIIADVRADAEALIVERRRKDRERKALRNSAETPRNSSEIPRNSAETPRVEQFIVYQQTVHPQDDVRDRSRSDTGEQRKSPTPPIEITSSLRSEVGGGTCVDARAREYPSDKTIREESRVLADEVMQILGIDTEFIPPGWCGAPLWFEQGLRSGWKPEIVRIAAQRVAKTKKDGPPDGYRYLGKPIAREHKLAEAPIPSVSPVGGINARQDQRELPLLRSVGRRGFASLAVEAFERAKSKG